MCAWIGSDSAPPTPRRSYAAIALANNPSYAPHIEAVIVGNESQVSWSDGHLVPHQRSSSPTSATSRRASPSRVTVADNWYWWSGGDANGANLPAGRWPPRSTSSPARTSIPSWRRDHQRQRHRRDHRHRGGEDQQLEYQIVEVQVPGDLRRHRSETGWATAGSFDQTLSGDPSLAEPPEDLLRRAHGLEPSRRPGPHVLVRGLPTRTGSDPTGGGAGGALGALHGGPAAEARREPEFLETPDAPARMWT